MKTIFDETQTPKLRSISSQVINCEEKDNEGLNDFQKLPDPQGIAIQKVGINRYRVPLTFAHSEQGSMSHDSTASMFVNLPAGKTGINMSRLVKILQDESLDNPVNYSLMKSILNKFRYELRDSEKEAPFSNAYLSFNFDFPLKQKSLKSDNWGWQYYQTTIEAQENKKGENKFFITVDYEYSSTCPCSLSMAKQYETDFREGRTQEGSGLATAHSQRSRARVKAQIDQTSSFFIEDLIKLLRQAIPTETQSLVKRVDEQAFAILNGQNPMFVEHASKRLYKALNTEKNIIDWSVKIEHFESLHSHNAVSYLYKNNEDGLRELH